jgi:transcriptional regulator with XRE-family HTH domain
VSSVDAYKTELAAFLRRFGANVRRARAAKDPPCSQERLSYATRLHRTEIGRIEQGTVEPRLTTLLILAEGLDVSVEELLRDLAAPEQRKPASNGGGWR